MKKMLIRAVTLFLVCGMLTVSAFAATTITTEPYEGSGNTYRFSAESLGTAEHIYYTEETFPELNPISEEWEDKTTQVPHTITTHLFPVGTVISSDFITKEEDAHLFVDINEEGNYLWSESMSGGFTMEYHDTFTIPDAKNIYYVYTVYDYCPLMQEDVGFWVKGVDASSTPTSPTQATGFADVAAGSYCADAVKWAVEKDITSGTTTTTFSPADTCTKAQILTFLWRAKGQPAPTIANPFADVPESAYYYKAALWAYENGMVTGTAFNAATSATRSQTVTYLWMLAGKPTAAKDAAFTDVPSSAEYAKAVAWAVDRKITSGTGAAAFSPDDSCTRGQIVTFLYRDMAK